MGFIQIVVAEADATPSGASLRNTSNFEILSTLWSERGGGRIVSLRADKTQGLRPAAATVAPLLATDIANLIDVCQTEMPDFVLFEGVRLYQAITALSQALRSQAIIVDMHNIESILQAQIDAQKLPPLLRAFAPWIFAQRRKACLQVDKQIIQISRQVWVCSETDHATAQALLSPKSIAIVPNPIPDWAMKEDLRKETNPTEVLFVGHLGYQPNGHAVKTLCKNIMPQLRRIVPNAQLHICGRRPRRRLAALVLSRGNRLTPNAVNLAEVYATAAAVAIPLHAGGGTRLKILEAMAVGCPVIATAKAVEGLNLVPQLHYRNAETNSNFSRQIADVLLSPNLAAEMANRACRFILERYGKSARIRAVSNALAQGKFMNG